VTGTAALVTAAAAESEFEQVLAGAGLAESAAVLAGRLDRAFLTEARLGPGEPGVVVARRASVAG
jgi:hypothetical protein